MKKLAKLTALFAGICLVLAFSACSHSGKEYDWKNPDGGSKDPEVNEVLTLTNEWDGGSKTLIFYDDATFYYEKVDGDDILQEKGTCDGDVLGGKEVTLSVTRSNWNDEGWKDKDGYGFSVTVNENGTASVAEWWTDDETGEIEKGEAETYTVKTEEEGETGGTTEGGSESGGGDTTVFEGTVQSVLGNSVSFILSPDGSCSWDGETGTYAKSSNSGYEYKLTSSDNQSGYYLTTTGSASCAYWYMKEYQNSSTEGDTKTVECVDYGYIDHKGTWEPYSWSNDGTWSEYIVLAESEYYLWLVGSGGSHSDSQEGEYEYKEGEQMTLEAKKWWDNDEFSGSVSGYGLYMTIDEYGYASVMGYNTNHYGVYKKTSDKYSK